MQNTLDAEGAKQNQNGQQQESKSRPLKTIPRVQLENRIDTLRETKPLDPKGQLPQYIQQEDL